MASNVKGFEITVPEKNDLCCAICRVTNHENECLIYSQYCSNKLKCRQFLQETPQAMAAPVTNRKILEAGGVMYVIVTKDLFEDYTFQDHCDSFNVQVMDLLDSIPAYVYKTCLLFTVEYKLAPRWNKVGLYLVEGEKFLSATGNVNAITLNIREIHGNSARLQMEAVNLKIPFVRLDAARPSPHDMHPPVRVLPSLKMADVLSVSKIIKDKSKFRDYEHLRTYWRDMHGYLLPDYAEGSLFYDIEFFYFKSSVFLYPETCLTSGPVRVLPPSMDPVSVIYRFAGELRSRVSILCGQQLDLCPENAYRAALEVRTPVLPKTPRLPRVSGYDSGYGTKSKTVSSTVTFRTPDTCEVPIKRMRMSLTRTDDFSVSESGDLEINPTRFTSRYQREHVGNLSVILHDADDLKVIVSKEESKSSYFGDEQARSCAEEPTDKEERPNKLSLREKLLMARDDE